GKDARSGVGLLNIERPADEPARERYIYYPDTAPVPESISANIRNRSYKVLSDVVIDEANAAGVILTGGSRFGGHVLFVKDRKLHYVYNFLGIRPEQHLVSKRDRKSTPLNSSHLPISHALFCLT